MKQRLPFYLLAALVMAMACATFMEKYRGTETASDAYYHSWWFILLWGVTAVTGCINLLRGGIKNGKLPGVALHLSLALILFGALVTHLTALHGMIHLRKDVAENYFTARHHRFWEDTETGTPHKLPFALTLKQFKVEYYPGTEAPADYVSTVTLTRPGGAPSSPVDISMNHILRSEGYRFYQTSFDADNQGTWLSINYDPYGVPLTYTGYALLALSMWWVLIQPGGRFRRLLRHPALRGAMMAAIGLFLGTASLHAQDTAVSVTASHTIRLKKKVIPEDLALKIGALQVLYSQRTAPLQTLARDFTLKLSGKSHYKGLQPEQVLCGWIFCPEEWQFEPLITIKNTQLAEMLGHASPAPLTAFFGPGKEYKLKEYAGRMPREEAPSPLKKALTETDEKIQLILMLESGSLLKLFPVRVNGAVNWYAPTDSLPPSIPADKARFVRGWFTLLYENVLNEDYDTASLLVDKLSVYQHREGGTTALTNAKVQAERMYNRFEPTAWLYRLCLTSGLIGFLLLIWKPVGGWAARSQLSLSIALTIMFLLLTATVALRSYIAGRLPLSNGYETMLFLAWVIQLFALYLRKKLPLAVTFGLLLSGFTLLVSTLGQMNPQITPLMPVLLSPWLSLHVSLIMMAYALYAFTFLCGITAPILLWQKRKAEVERLTVLSRLLLYPATFLLGAGIFIGAVWANVSWGNYWSWDPKEVWALISFLVYAIPLHDTSLPFFRRHLGYHIYMILAFSTLLMTYFGVNYFLGGMHSYAG